MSKEVLQSHTQRSSSLFLFGQVTSEVTLLKSILSAASTCIVGSA
ncbi:hypothetical protein STFR1_30016 [Bacillus vallismortis]